MIQTINLVKEYANIVAVNGVNLEVKPGEVFGFLGPNGAGKTTTIKMIVGTLQPSSGKVLIDGIDVAENPIEAKRITGFIPDRPYIYEKLTAMEFLLFVAGLYNMEPGFAEKRGLELLGLFGLSDWADQLVEQFSHGMRQRLIMSSAFLHQPKLIVVDEPMVGLDPKGARLVKKLFREAADSGMTIFMSTHTLEVAEELCDRIAIIQNGTVVSCGTMDELRARSRSGAGLEQIFMELTGGEEMADVIRVLKDEGDEK
jgi:ABC-2 type transport system ATP-binding protein